MGRSVGWLVPPRLDWALLRQPQLQQQQHPIQSRAAPERTSEHRLESWWDYSGQEPPGPF